MGYRRTGRRRFLRRPADLDASGERGAAPSDVVPVARAAPVVGIAVVVPPPARAAHPVDVRDAEDVEDVQDEVGEQLERLRRECEVVRNDLVVARSQLEEMTAKLPRPSDPSLAAAAAATSTGELPAFHAADFDVDIDDEPEPDL